MSAPGRWLRLDVGCFESEWLAALSVGAQHAWTRLLLHTKGQGTSGTVKRLGPVAAEKLWSIPPVSLQEMENAAIADGALRIEDGWWVVTGWDKYQQPDRTNAIRKQRLRDKRKSQDTGGIPRSVPGTRHATKTVTKTKTTSTPAVEGEFQKAWDSFPKRSGSNSRQEALEAFSARVTEGVDPKAMIEAAEKYRIFAEATAKTGTEYVMQASSFFGRKKRGWEQDWTPPTNGNGKGGHRTGAPRTASDGRTLL